MKSENSSFAVPAMWLGVLIVIAIGVPFAGSGGFQSAHLAASTFQVADPVDKFLAALSKVESNDNDQAVGDGGRALGRYQIHRAYWQDSGVPGSYEQVTNPEYARSVVLAYFKRYAPEALKNQDWETLARIHNGGPGIMRRKGSRAWKNTTAYWDRVKAAMG